MMSWELISYLSTWVLQIVVCSAAFGCAVLQLSLSVGADESTTQQ
jgi:hypothetical protein